MQARRSQIGLSFGLWAPVHHTPNMAGSPTRLAFSSETRLPDPVSELFSFLSFSFLSFSFFLLFERRLMGVGADGTGFGGRI